jgi:hypothetical protein
MHLLLQLPRSLPVAVLLWRVAAYSLLELLYMLFDMVFLTNAPA